MAGVVALAGILPSVIGKSHGILLVYTATVPRFQFIGGTFFGRSEEYRKRDTNVTRYIDKFYLQRIANPLVNT